MIVNRGQKVVLWLLAVLLSGVSVGIALSISSDQTQSVTASSFLLIVFIPAVFLGGMIVLDRHLLEDGERRTGYRAFLWILTLGLSFIAVVTGGLALSALGYSDTYMEASRRAFGLLLVFVGPIVFLGGRVFLSVTFPRPKDKPSSLIAKDRQERKYKRRRVFVFIGIIVIWLALGVLIKPFTLQMGHAVLLLVSSISQAESIAAIIGGILYVAWLIALIVTIQYARSHYRRRTEHRGLDGPPRERASEDYTQSSEKADNIGGPPPAKGSKRSWPLGLLIGVSAVIIVLLAWVAGGIAGKGLVSAYFPVSVPLTEHFTSTEGRFSVDTPVNLTESTQSSQSAVGPLKMYVFSGESRDAFYAVMYVDYPGAAVHANPRKILLAAEKGSIKTTNGQLMSDTAISLEGYPGRDVVLEATGGGVLAEAKEKLVLVGRRLYVVETAAPKSESSTTELDAFLNSFKLKKSSVFFESNQNQK